MLKVVRCQFGPARVEGILTYTVLVLSLYDYDLYLPIATAAIGHDGVFLSQ